MSNIRRTNKDEAERLLRNKIREEAFTQAAEYVLWAKHHFKTHTEIEFRLREMAKEKV